MTVEAMVEIRPRRGLTDQRWCSGGGEWQPVLGGTAEVRILGEGGEAPPAGLPELLASLEVERLRGLHQHTVEVLAARAETDERFLGGAEDNLLLHDLRAALSAPPPDLGPLKELVAATAGFAGTSADGTQGPIGRARDALLAAYPCLGEE
jgi:hypothetical protein